MRDAPAKGMYYLPMGPWPGFIGLAFAESAFRAELKRLDVKAECAFLAHPRAAATLHEFVSPSGAVVWLLCLGSVKGRTKEQIAGLIAHEAMHIIQHMQNEYAGGRCLGVEAEAYMMQMIVQETLQRLWKSRTVREEIPSNT